MARPRECCCERCPTNSNSPEKQMKEKTDKRKPVAQYRERIYRLIRRIPRGQVMTYGQIACIFGEGYTPRTISFRMNGADERSTPWHRVINSQGRCSTSRVLLPPDKQLRMLEAEGVKFDASGCCDLETYLWRPDQEQVEKRETAR